MNDTDAPVDSSTEQPGLSPIGVDQHRFAGLFEKSRPRLMKLSRRILGGNNDAEDAVNDTYLKAFASLSSFDGQNLDGWLSRIAQHICIDRIRSNHPARPLDDFSELAAAYDEMRAVTPIQIRTILAKLPEAQRQCLKLFYIEGFSAKEVAKLAGFTEKEVKSHLQNGRRNFKLQWQALEQKRHE